LYAFFDIIVVYVDFPCLYDTVTPTTDESKRVVVGAQGTTMSGFRQLLEEPNHIGMRGILRPCRYGTTWLKEGL